MPNPVIITTTEAISAAYDFLGRPDKNLLPPTIVCTKYWLMLGKLQDLLNISDRTFYLNKKEDIVVAQNQLELDLGEIENFGNELAFERVDRSSGVEQTSPVPLISDMRDKDSVAGLCAFLFRDSMSGNIVLRFNRRLAETYTFRLWYEPGTFARPKLSEQPLLPKQGINLLIIETAAACLPDLSKIYEQNVYRAFAESVNQQRVEFRTLFDQWRMKNTGAGVKHRRAYNESRRRPRGSRIILPREPV